MAAFAGILILLIGIFNAIDGIVAIANSHSFAIYSNGYAPSDLRHAERIELGDPHRGDCAAFGCIRHFSRQGWGAVVGITVTSLSASGQLPNPGVDPWWSISVIAVDGLIIYGLALDGLLEVA